MFRLEKQNVPLKAQLAEVNSSDLKFIDDEQCDMSTGYLVITNSRLQTKIYIRHRCETKPDLI
ncbi:hypothetical protein Hanom_Chr06g00544571 [Helianthus anomalus]